MKIKKLMERLARFLDADTKTQLDEIHSIRKVLKVLKEKEHKLRNNLERGVEGEAAEELQIKLDVIHAQRRKGLERVQTLRDALKGKDGKEK